MKKLIHKILFFLYCLLVLFSPLIYVSNSTELYEFPKMFYVYAIGSTVLFIYSIQIAICMEKPKFKLPTWGVLLYVIFLVLSFLLSSHHYTSLWGYYSRFNDGLLSTLIMFGLYFVGLQIFSVTCIGTLKNTILLTVFPISTLGIFQSTDIDRVYSSFGQPNWLAAYLVMVMPLSIEKILLERHPIMRIFWIFGYFLCLICLWYTGSLSGLVGLVAGGVYLLLSTGKAVPKKIVLPVLVLFCVLGVLNSANLKNRLHDALVVSGNPGDYRISDPGLIRLGLWKGSIKLFFSKPKIILLGTGLETFPYEFPFFRESWLNLSSEWDFILNKPHNYYLETLVESGMGGLLSYLVVIYALFKARGDRYLLSGLMGYLVSNFFGWPTVSSTLLFWIYVSMLHNRREER